MAKESYWHVDYISFVYFWDFFKWKNLQIYLSLAFRSHNTIKISQKMSEARSKAFNLRRKNKNLNLLSILDFNDLTPAPPP